MNGVALVLAIAGFLISLALAGLKVWESFLSRGRFDCRFAWYDASDNELELRFTVANVGYRQESVAGLFVGTPRTRAYRSEALDDLLPMMLQSAQVSATFSLPVRTDEAYDPDTSLFVGEADLSVVDSRGRVRSFHVPGFYASGVDKADRYVRVPPPPKPDGVGFSDVRDSDRSGWEIA